MSEAVAVTVVVAPLLPVHSTTFGAEHVIVGGVVSTTSALEPHCRVFDEGSVAEHVIGVVPRGKLLPEAGLHEADTRPQQASLAVALKVALACWLPVHSTVCAVGQWTDGGVVSATFTANEQEPGFPDASDAWQPTEVVPRAKLVPEAGLQVALG